MLEGGPLFLTVLNRLQILSSWANHLAWQTLKRLAFGLLVELHRWESWERCAMAVALRSENSHGDVHPSSERIFRDKYYSCIGGINVYGSFTKEMGKKIPELIDSFLFGFSKSQFSVPLQSALSTRCRDFSTSSKQKTTFLRSGLWRTWYSSYLDSPVKKPPKKYAYAYILLIL